MKRTKLCFLADHMSAGGLEKVVCDAVDALYDQYDITVHTLGGGINDTIRKRLNGKVHFVDSAISPQKRILAMFPVIGSWIFRRAIQGHFDILIVLRSSLMLAARSGIAEINIFWDHSDKSILYAAPETLSLFRKANRLRLIYGYRKYDAVWVVCDAIRDAFVRAFRHSNVIALLNPVDISRIHTLAKETVPQDPFPADTFRFVVVSRLSEEKGVERVLYAMRELHQHKKCAVLIVGDGPDQKALEAYVNEHGLQSCVSFLGYQENPYPYIANSDALLCPSRFESFGLSILEAMALKTVVLSTRTTGGQFMLEDGKYGVLVDNSDDSLMDGMLSIMDGNHPDVERAYLHSLEFDKVAFEQRVRLLIERTIEETA